MKPWWPRSVRTTLTLWYAAAMVVTLTAYAASVYTFVSHNTSKALDDRLHSDIRWVAEMAEQSPDGSLVWYEGDDASGEEDSPWLQVWSPTGDLLLRSNAAERIPIGQSRPLALQADGQIRSVGVGTNTYRILSATSVIAGRTVVVQVAGSEARLRREIRGLLLILVLGLPLGVLAACLGGYMLARRALAPVDHMAERARSITAARLGDRLPVDNPDDELGRLATVFNETFANFVAAGTDPLHQRPDRRRLQRRRTRRRVPPIDAAGWRGRIAPGEVVQWQAMTVSAVLAERAKLPEAHQRQMRTRAGQHVRPRDDRRSVSRPRAPHRLDAQAAIDGETRRDRERIARERGHRRRSPVRRLWRVREVPDASRKAVDRFADASGERAVQRRRSARDVDAGAQRMAFCA